MMQMRGGSILLRIVGFVVALLAPLTALVAQQVDLTSGSVVQAVTHFKAGEYVWAPEVAPKGPMLLIVNVATQRAVLFRNGVPIGASTVSTGRPGHATPTGVFTILQKQVEHYSSLYDDAPMPYMQRLTWQGVALHAGNLPGYPASHGCIRLPAGFAKLLYGETKVGMTVVVTHEQATPRVAPAPAIITQGAESSAFDAGFLWDPIKAPTGPISILVSTADRRAIVLRNGVVIGSAPVTVDGPVAGTWAYALRNIDKAGQHWIRLTLSPRTGTGDEIAKSEWSRFHASEEFKRAVAGIIEPGTTIIVTSDSVAENSVKPVTVLEGPQ
jgi:hypothetical protein